MQLGLYIWFQKLLTYSRNNFFIKNILYYFSLPINKIYKLSILLNIFLLNCMIIFDEFFKMISIKNYIVI